MELVVAGLVIALIVQQVIHSRERSVLLDRIQAPDRAPFTPAKREQPVEEDEDARRHLELAMAPDA